LVVIAIIAILAAILFPVFARARENARRASCQSNLKQLQLGLIQYTQDYDETYPRYSLNDYDPADSSVRGWTLLVQPYLKSVQIFQCPSEKTNPDDTAITRGYSDYWMNLYVYGGASGTATAVPKLSQFSNTAQTIINFDGWQWQSNMRLGWNDFNNRCISHLGSDDYYNMARRHLDGANYSFADGHVKWYRPEKITCGDPAASSSPNFAVDSSTDCTQPT
jgi:prepilin-type processing-associated H-X9-DG protein